MRATPGRARLDIGISDSQPRTVDVIGKPTNLPVNSLISAGVMTTTARYPSCSLPLLGPIYSRTTSPASGTPLCIFSRPSGSASGLLVRSPELTALRFPEVDDRMRLELRFAKLLQIAFARKALDCTVGTNLHFALNHMNINLLPLGECYLLRNIRRDAHRKAIAPTL
ncbi:hypothetical protein F01_200235 [Burkholderia cenocepacia]|nr:hypothetical protein F01_200235 [Burkholderia cenocepacia]